MGREPLEFDDEALTRYLAAANEATVIRRARTPPAR
jgi:hypothetical protein